MPKAKITYPEIEDLRQDIDSLKDNVVKLTKHITKDGATQTENIKENVSEQFQTLKTQGQAYVSDAEDMVKKKPMQSVAIAFAAGIVGSLLLSRRG